MFTDDNGSPYSHASGQLESARCGECGCKTGGSSYCYKHAPYTVTPLKDGTWRETGVFGTRRCSSVDERDKQPRTLIHDPRSFTDLEREFSDRVHVVLAEYPATLACKSLTDALLAVYGKGEQ